MRQTTIPLTCAMLALLATSAAGGAASPEKQSFAICKEPGRYIEYFVDESWVEHLRRLDLTKLRSAD